MGVKIDKIIIGHTRNIVGNYSVRLFLFIGLTVFSVNVRVYKIYVMGKNGGGFVVCEKVGKQLLINLFHHGTNDERYLCRNLTVAVNFLVVITFSGAQSLEMLGVHSDIILAVAVFNDVCNKVVYNFRIV